MPDRNKVYVRIGGKEYTLVGIESEEYLQRVGNFIDKKMSEVTRLNSKLSTQMVAVLTSLNVADSCFKLQQCLNEAEEDKKSLRAELDKLKHELGRLNKENSELKERNTEMQNALIRRESEPADNVLAMDKRLKVSSK